MDESFEAFGEISDLVDLWTRKPADKSSGPMPTTQTMGGIVNDDFTFAI